MLRIALWSSTRITALHAKRDELAERLAQDEGSVSGETVIIIGIIVVIALAVGVILTGKVIGKAKGINF